MSLTDDEDETPMDIPYAIERSHLLFAAVVSHLYAQIDPRELGESIRMLTTSEEYAIRVMSRWGYPELERDERRRIAQTLVWGYPTHGFVIDLDEAIEIGLNAKRLDAIADEVCIEILRTLGADASFIGFAEYT